MIIRPSSKNSLFLSQVPKSFFVQTEHWFFFLLFLLSHGMYITDVSIFGSFVHFECFSIALGYYIGIWRLSLQLLLRWWHLLIKYFDSFASDRVTFHARFVLRVSFGGNVSHLLRSLACYVRCTLCDTQTWRVWNVDVLVRLCLNC